MAKRHNHDGHDDHEHDDFESIVVDIPEIADPADLVARIEAMAKDQNILRVKGYAAAKGTPMRLLVQAVGARVRQQYDQPWGITERLGRLASIAEHDHVTPDAFHTALVEQAVTHVDFR